MNGGESGIRTHGTLMRTPVFETGPIDHSGISPHLDVKVYQNGRGNAKRFWLWLRKKISFLFSFFREGFVKRPSFSLVDKNKERL